jgi:hypothetical protein
MNYPKTKSLVKGITSPGITSLAVRRRARFIHEPEAALYQSFLPV